MCRLAEMPPPSRRLEDIDPPTPEQKTAARRLTRAARRSNENMIRRRFPYVTCAGAHAIAILTEWDAFKCTNLDYQKIFDSMQKPAFIFDGRNIVDIPKLQAIGFHCWAVGKSLTPTIS